MGNCVEGNGDKSFMYVFFHNSYKSYPKHENSVASDTVMHILTFEKDRIIIIFKNQFQDAALICGFRFYHSIFYLDYLVASLLGTGSLCWQCPVSSHKIILEGTRDSKFVVANTWCVLCVWECSKCAYTRKMTTTNACSKFCKTSTYLVNQIP